MFTTLKTRPEVRFTALAVVLAVAVGATSPDPSATDHSDGDESHEVPASAPLAGGPGTFDSPLADPSLTRGPAGSVGTDGSAEPEPAFDGTDRVGGAEVPAPLSPPFGRRPHVNDGDAPDPHLIHSGEEYVVFSTNSGGLNVPTRTSTDLANWSEPTDAAPQLPSWGRSDLTWAPTAARIGDRWVLYAAVLHRGTGTHCIAAFTSGSATGPYDAAAEPVRCSGRGVIDPYILVDEGRPHLYWKAVGGRTHQLFGAELRPDGLAITGETVHLATASATWEGGGVENPAMVRTGAGHLLFYSANWWTGSRYAIGYSVCDGPLGPCSKATRSGPWLASSPGVKGPGGQSLTLGPDGRVWMAYHAWTPTIGYGAGGHRRLHVEPLLLDDGRPQVDNRAPTGASDPPLRWPGGVLVGGWVADTDHPVPTLARVSVDGEPVATPTAGFRRNDVASAHPHLGPWHGVLAAIAVPAGRHRICVTAVDDRELLDVEVGCHEVTIDPSPFGEQETFTRAADGSVTITGWAIDPQGTDAATVEVTVTDRTTTARADRPREGLGERYPGHGDDHGFAVTVAVPAGEHQLCVRVRGSQAPTATIRCTRVRGTTAPPASVSTTTTGPNRPSLPVTSSSTSTTNTTRAGPTLPTL